jgi:hypothetical protein
MERKVQILFLVLLQALRVVAELTQTEVLQMVVLVVVRQ